MLKIQVGEIYTKEERDIIEKRYPVQTTFKYAGFGMVELVTCNNRIHNKEITA